MKKRISVPFLAAAIVVLALLAVIVIAKPFPQKASAVFPEKLLELPCTVARESIDGAEKIDLTNDQKGALLNELETIQAVRQILPRVPKCPNSCRLSSAPYSRMLKIYNR
mgnify:CR=1 FL=1